MSKNLLSRYEIKHPYKLPESATSKFSVRKTSNNKRVKTEAYDFEDSKEKASSKKMELTAGLFKQAAHSKSTKKANPLVYKHEKKGSQVGGQVGSLVGNQASNHRLSEMTTTLSKTKEPRQFKGSQELLSTHFGTRGLTKNSQDKKHTRMKTEACDEKPTKIADIYKKLSNISVVKERDAKNPEKNYKVEEVVGKGTFGVVYRATDKTTQQCVAIKKVLQDKRYKNRELQIMRLLHHPNVLEIRDHYYTQQGSQEYLNVVVDFFEENLYDLNRKRVRKGEGIPPLLVKVYTYQMLKAINYLAALSVAHRDIKPHNILVDPGTNKLVVCDFGSAKQLVPSNSFITQRRPTWPTSARAATAHRS